MAGLDDGLTDTLGIFGQVWLTGGYGGVAVEPACAGVCFVPCEGVAVTPHVCFSGGVFQWVLMGLGGGGGGGGRGLQVPVG